MIPKIIHYIWFGGKPLPELAQKCLDSWKKYCPDYEIMRWDESNFDLNFNDYVKEAYEAKKWAFVSDVARLYALVNYGGIYMDTDVEVIKPLDDLLEYEAVSGFESSDKIAAGLLACEKDNEIFNEFLQGYEGAHFVKEDGALDTTTIVARLTALCVKYDVQLNNTKQTVNGFTLLPVDYFYPKEYLTNKLNITSNTLCIHHYDASWIPDEEKYALQKAAKYRKFMPKRMAGLCGKFRAITKYRGLKCALKETFGWAKRK